MSDENVPVGNEETPVGEESAFFTWEADDGTVTEFKKPGELADFLRHSGMRKSDYDTKMNQLTERSTYFDEQQKKLEQAMKELEPTRRWHEALKQRPELVERLKQEFEGKRPDIDRLFEERLAPYKKELEELKSANAQRDEQHMREQAFQQLKQVLPDADENALAAELQRLNEVPEQDRMRSLYEVLHYNLVGRNIKPSAPPRPPTATSTPGTSQKGKKVEEMNRKEVAEAALKELEGLET